MPMLEDLEPVPPLVVEVTRGNSVESRHLVSAVAVDTEGRVAFRAGDTGRPVYPRSAIKPLQALAMVESGAVEAFRVSQAEIALASASHAGEPVHIAAVAGWLERIGCTAADLECGAHLPSDATSARALLRAGEEPSALHNNCSGKHTGFLTLARHRGWPTAGYIGPAHPVQQTVLGILETMTGLDLTQAPRGTDGCGIPTIAIPLANMALAMARLADPEDQPERRRAACAQVRAAMTAEPAMVGGRQSACTRIISTTGGRALAKGGAEGVYCAALPEPGLGLALKVADGARRASEVAVAHLLRRFEAIGEAEAARLGELLEAPVVNRAGRVVGHVRMADDAGA